MINNEPRSHENNINLSLHERPNFPRVLASLTLAGCMSGKRRRFARAVSADVPCFTAHSALVITKVNAAIYYPVCYRLQRIQ